MVIERYSYITKSDFCSGDTYCTFINVGLGCAVGQ
jgi:hypothetical protein